MKTIYKLFTISILLVTNLFSNSVDEKVLKFEKDRFSANKRIELKEVSINTKKELSLKGWFGYIIDIKALVQDKEIKAKDIVFSNGEVVAPELLDIKTGKSFKDILTPSLTTSYYKKSRLIAGSSNAKDKIVIFSDPLCPYCIDYVPEVIKHVKKNSKTIALYYYHFPLLQIHPAADILTKLMDVAKHQGIKDIELKIYDIDWEKYFKASEKSAQKIIDAFNSELKTKITFAQVMDNKIRKEILSDVQMGEDVMVQGTPTVFINGQEDKSKLKYETLGK